MNDRINRKKYGNFLIRRYKPDPIIKVKCTKPKNESLKVHLVKKKAKYEYIEVIFAHLVRKKAEYEYTEVIFTREMVKYDYSECIKIQEIIFKHKGVHA